MLHNLSCKRIQMDEIWSFCYTDLINYAKIVKIYVVEAGIENYV